LWGTGILRHMNKKPLLVLVDGSAVFYRGYYALPPTMTNKEGFPTNALYGFTTIFLKMLTDLNPQYVIVTWDKSGTTFRNDMYPEYKGTRKATPDDLKIQMPILKDLMGIMNVPFVELDQFEADDIIGTLAAQAEVLGTVRTLVMTGDLDELQLVDKNTVVRIAKTNGESIDYDIAKVHERYGVTPKQFIDVKALKGDASDNIPGVPGIGEKGAMDLIGKYGSLDEVYAHVADQTPGLQKKLTEGKDLAYLSQKLSTIVCDAPVTLDLEAATLKAFDGPGIHDMFRKLDFRSLLAKLPEEIKIASADGELTLFSDGVATPKERKHLAEADYKAVLTEQELDDLVGLLGKQDVFAFDTETTSVDTFSADLVGLSFSWKAGTGYYVPVGHTEGKQLNRDLVLAKLKPVLENPKIGKVGHNIKFDYEMIKRYGVRVAPVVMDTMVAAFLLNSLGRSQSLDGLAYDLLDIEMIPITDLIGTGKTQGSFDQTPIEDAVIYASEDADITWRIYEILKPQLEEKGLTKLGDETEWPLIPVLGDMELAGIELDVKFLEDFKVRLDKNVGELATQIYGHAGQEFNLNSPSQLGQILYGRLELSTVGLKKGKTGFSTAAAELEKLRDAHPIVPLLMNYRELDKLKSTYVDALPQLVKSDGRIHTSFNQTIAQTGRLSSTNPNLQNIPVRTELGREIRQAFVAPKGRVLVSADYSQIELRVAAALAHDEDMIETFEQGIDLHQKTAAELYSVPLEEVSKEMRGNAKTINFGVLYGMSAHGLSVATGMDQKEASDFIKRFFEVRPALAKYIEETKKFAHDNEYTQTLFGRRRPCPEINSSNFMLRSGAERMAVNVPIQGTAADIYKLAMIKVAEKLDNSSLLLLQIHDELIVETDADKGDAVAAMMKETMEAAFDIGVPLAVDIAVGTNWGQL
jgi:DNA polymerase-1